MYRLDDSIIRKFLLSSCALACLVLMPVEFAFSALNLSAMPVSGGNSIRFGRVDLPSSNNQEVRIRITSTESTQYQIFQRVNQAFQNQRGETLDFNAIEVATLSGSNSSGSLELQAAEPLGFSESLIYTSSNNGLSDSFVIIYQANPDQIAAAGEYYGQIVYTLRPIGGSSGSREEVVLNAFLEVADDFNLNTSGSSGRDRVRLSSEGSAHQEGHFKISFDGNRSQSVKIFQEIIQYPANELNENINTESVQLFVSGGINGELGLGDKTTLSRRRELIYSSSAQNDDIWINFELDDTAVSAQKAGQYNGRINYIVETGSVSNTYPVDLEVDVAPVFELTTEYPPGGMSFKGLLPNAEPQLREVLVRVKSNMGKPYMVSQNVSTGLTNERGEQIASDNFTVKQELIDSAPGRVEDDGFSTIRPGDAPLYYSDKIGSPTEFKVIYQLRPYQKMQAGDYKTSVIYTLGEI